MKRSTKMLMMAGGNKRDQEYNRGYRMEYGPEDKFRDRRGREHYDNGRYAPQSRMGDYDINSHWLPPYYSERMRDWSDMRYEPQNNYMGMNYSDDRSYTRPIGFERNYETNMHGGSVVNFPSKREGDRMHGENNLVGGARSMSVPELNESIAHEWMRKMENSDGTRGPHWNMEQIRSIMEKHGIREDPIKFQVAMNATYSDLSEVFKKLGINNIDAYISFAKAFWLDDQDAVKDKLASYYEYVVKH